MARPRLNTRSGKLIKMFPDFSGGLNTAGALHQVNDNEFVEVTNADIDEEGSVSKRKGFTQIVATLGSGKMQNLFLFKSGSGRVALGVHGGKLYKYVTAGTSLLGTGAWSEIVIRRHVPQNVKAVDTGSGAVGPNLVAGTNYDYGIVAKDASGATVLSSVSRVTTGGTPFPITVTWDKVYGATSYEVYRNNVRITSLGDVATWTDDGNTAPSADEPPVANTTVVTFSVDGEFVTWNDKCYFTTGNGVCVFDGANAALVTPYVPTSLEETNVGTNAFRDVTSSIHQCKYIKMHWERMFLCGDPTYKQNVYMSDLGLGKNNTLWLPTPLAFDVTTDNGEPISGVTNFRDFLVFFTNTSIHTLFGKQPDTTQDEYFILRMTNSAIGAVSHRSIVVVNNSVIFVSKLGIYALVNVTASDKYLNVQHLSTRVDPTFKKLTSPEKAVATFHNQQYKVSFPADGTVLRWYVTRQSWTLDTKPLVNAYMVWDTDLYIGSYTDGLVYKHGVKRVEVVGSPGTYVEEDTYSDDGTAISFRFRTKTFDMDAMINYKKFRKLYVMARQYTVTTTCVLYAYIDYEETSYIFDFNESTVLGTWELGESRLGWVDVVFQEVRFKGKGRQAYFIFENALNNEPVTIYGLGAQYKIKAA